MYEKIFFTGLLFLCLMLIVPKIIGNDVPLSVKTVFIVSGIAGFVAMIVSSLMIIWS